MSYLSHHHSQCCAHCRAKVPSQGSSSYPVPRELFSRSTPAPPHIGQAVLTSYCDRNYMDIQWEIFAVAIVFCIYVVIRCFECCTTCFSREIVISMPLRRLTWVVTEQHWKTFTNFTSASSISVFFTCSLFVASTPLLHFPVFSLPSVSIQSWILSHMSAPAKAFVGDRFGVYQCKHSVDIHSGSLSVSVHHHCITLHYS